MNPSQRIAAVAALVTLAGALACASHVDVDVDGADRDLIARSRTWTFLKHDPPLPDALGPEDGEFTYRVTSPLRNAAELDAAIARSLRDAFARLGYTFVEHDADLYVHYRLTLRPRRDAVEVPFAQNYVASHSYTPSYIVEGTDVVTRKVEELRLEVDLREARGRIVWRGIYEDLLSAGQDLDLDENVGALMTRIPGRGDRSLE